MIVITGGAGFIGSALIWRLNQDKIDDILVVDRFNKQGQWMNLRRLHFKDLFHIEDFLEEIDVFLKETGVLVHLGACSDTTEQDFSYLIRENFETTKVLARACLDRGVKFVYASSAATYGKGEFGFDDKDEDLLYKLRPLNPYAYSKHLFDLWALENKILNDIVGIKYFNVFGPNEYHKGHMRSMVVKAYEQIKETGRVKLFKSYHPDYADGEQKRDFIYIRDAVEMTLFLMNTPSARGIYNVGTGEPHTWLELVEPIFKALNIEMAVDFIDMPEDIRNQYQYETVADITKLISMGYKNPIWKLKTAVEDYVVHFLAGAMFLGDGLIDIIV